MHDWEQGYLYDKLISCSDLHKPKMEKDPQGKTEWTKERASAVQSAEAKKNDGKIEKGSHPAKAQSQADKNEGQ